MYDRPVVMVVEDDVEMNELQREFLAINGMDAVPAYTGVEAIEESRSSRADAVILDLMLPEMDGFETCRQLRSRLGEQLPIVIVSALDSEDSRRKGFDAGANAYFTKPFDPDEVVGKILELIKAGNEGSP